MSAADSVVHLLADLDRPATPTDEFQDALLTRLLAELRPASEPPRLEGKPWRHDRLRRRWGLVAVAAVLLVGGLLVAPAVSVGDRLLGLLQGARTAPEVQSPVWSPDGRKIAFVRRDHTYDLYVMNADGSGLLRLTRDTKVGAPTWSPNGQKLAFAGWRVGGKQGIYVVNTDGRGRRLLARGGGPAWSPFGRKIAFTHGAKVYVMNADGSDHRTLAARSAGGITWSPDGRKIVFVSDRDGEYDVYVMNADGSGQRKLTRRGG